MSSGTIATPVPATVDGPQYQHQEDHFRSDQDQSLIITLSLGDICTDADTDTSHHHVLVSWSWSSQSPPMDASGKHTALNLESLTLGDAAEVRWYLEQYLQEPLENERAIRARQILVNHGRMLTSSIISDWYFKTDVLHVTRVLVKVESAVWWQLDHVYWEALVDRESWSGAVPSRIAVIRLSGVDTPNNEAAERSASKMNLVIVSARPERDQDLTPRLVSSVIWDTVSSPEVAATSTLTHVRPATFDRLEQCLSERDFMHFDLLHLDLHGVQDESGRVYLRFLSSSTDESQPGLVPEDIDAEKLGALLHKHGIRKVVLNACRSATGSSHDTNIVVTLLKHGVTACVAMAMNIVGRSVQIFTQAWYEAYLTHRLPFAIATAVAQQALSTNEDRMARYGYALPFNDSVVPVQYLAEREADMLSPSIISSTHWQTASPLVLRQLFPVGRDYMLLEIESELLMQNRPILLSGDAAVGKTAIMQELQNWWQQTRLFDHIHMIKIDGSDIDIQLRLAQLCQVYALQPAGTNIAQCIQLLANAKHALFIDELDRLALAGQTMKRVTRRQLVQVIAAATGSRLPLILSSRWAETWLAQSVTRIPVGPLSNAAGQELFYSLLDLHKQHLDALDWSITIEENNYIEQLVKLLNGNPVAITLISWGLANNDRSFKAAYLRIVGGKPFRFAGGTMRQMFRSVGEIQDLIEQSEANFSSSGLTPAILTPFWRFCSRKDLNVYAWLCIMERLKVYGASLQDRARVIAEQLALHVETPTAKQDKEEEIDIDEATVYYEDITTATLQQDEDIAELDGQLEAMLKPFFDAGFLAHSFSDNSPRRYITIHPLLSIFLRASQTWAQCESHFSSAAATYAALRVQSWPLQLETTDPAWVEARHEAKLEFHNFYAAAVLGLHHCSSPIKYAAFIKDLRWLDTGTIGDPSRSILMSSIWEFAVELLTKQATAIAAISESDWQSSIVARTVPWNLSMQLSDQSRLQYPFLPERSTLLFQTRYHLLTYAVLAYTHQSRVGAPQRQKYAEIVGEMHAVISANEIPAPEPANLVRSDIDMALLVTKSMEGATEVDPELLFASWRQRQDAHDEAYSTQTRRPATVEGLSWSTLSSSASMAFSMPAMLQVRDLIDSGKLEQAELLIDTTYQKEIQAGGNDLITKAKLLTLRVELDKKRNRLQDAEIHANTARGLLEQAALESEALQALVSK